GVLITKRRVASRVIHPLIWDQVLRSGVAMLPIALFLAFALGLLIIGQTVYFTSRVGAPQFLGVVMVSVVVRELGPLLAAIIVLTRAGTANVIELGMARASREVEALELLGIDPIHYLVIPRIAGVTLGVFCLTVYVVVVALLSGFLWAFLQNVPILPSAYLAQFAAALRPMDFVALGLKSSAFGVIIALVVCYHGLGKPMSVEDLPRAGARALTQGVIFCVIVDALFFLAFLLL
ncbi:MAG: ABC transporter permease, partial [Verrucomicrobia bacterium]|nr:ABC transporter permease [Verrucomicrobiota bacterium]